MCSFYATIESIKMIAVQEYVTENGFCPFSRWLENLSDITARAKIRVRINRVRLGNFGDCKGVGDGIQELRIDFGPGYRVYFYKDGLKLVLLLCGGDKKSQARDIKNAIQYLLDYKRRKYNE